MSKNEESSIILIRSSSKRSREYRSLEQNYSKSSSDIPKAARFQNDSIWFPGDADDLVDTLGEVSFSTNNALEK